MTKILYSNFYNIKSQLNKTGHTEFAFEMCVFAVKSEINMCNV